MGAERRAAALAALLGLGACAPQGSGKGATDALQFVEPPLLDDLDRLAAALRVNPDSELVR